MTNRQNGNDMFRGSGPPELRGFQLSISAPSQLSALFTTNLRECRGPGRSRVRSVGRRNCAVIKRHQYALGAQNDICNASTTGEMLIVQRLTHIPPRHFHHQPTCLGHRRGWEYYPAPGLTPARLLLMIRHWALDQIRHCQTLTKNCIWTGP